ncbi:potassium voltage-gated channel subfamily H member 2-like isoform X3 [Clytia hemisphaerica]|uniref:Cyclic nucleotide-binding domain-containing protein n=1 Tax=Clytia hemisphaerica TaxID=252671 RepID=A0A7M5WZ34_9CNID
MAVLLVTRANSASGGRSPEHEGMIGLPRKFPSPEKDEDVDDEEEASCEELVVTGIPFASHKHAVGSLNPALGNIEVRRCNFVINHEGRFKVLWDWIVLVLVIFTAIQIPYYAAFSNNVNNIVLDVVKNNEVRPMLILSLIVDCMFVLDIFLNFRTTYIQSSSDVLEKNPKKLAIHYLRTWFIIDLLAAIPFDWIMHQRSYGGNTSTLVGLLKSARLLRLFRVARRLDRYSEYGLAVLFLLMCLFTLIAHWLACIWNGISLIEEGNQNSWVHRMDDILYPKNVTRMPTNNTLNGTLSRLSSNVIRMTQSQRYIASMYYIVSSLTSVGFGNIAATTELEQMFSIITMLLGALMYACIFGNMVAIVQRLYSKASTFHTQMNTIREFMKFYKIPEELRQSINNYVRREWAVTQGIDAETVLSRFPECIQADLTYELYQNTFHSVKPFREATVSCMRAMAMKFKTMTLQAGNFVVRQGEEINRLYIVGKGSLEVLHEGNLILYLTRNSTFGYDFKLCHHKPKAKANIRAANLVEIHYIHVTDFLEIMECYPKFFEQFKENYKHTYDINDPNEEGYFKQESKRKDDKIHIAAIARQALGMPILHKWNRIHRNGKSQRSNISQDEHDSHNNETDRLQNVETGTIPHCNGNAKQQLIANGSTTERQRTPPKRAPPERGSLLNKVVVTALDEESPKYDQNFNQRLCALETKLGNLLDIYDEKLTSVLSLLNEMKDDRKHRTSNGGPPICESET